MFENRRDRSDSSRAELSLFARHAGHPRLRSRSRQRRLEVRTVVEALCAVSEPVVSWYLWRPKLRDPTDGMVFETVGNGIDNPLVTLNQRKVSGAPQKLAIMVPAY